MPHQLTSGRKLTRLWVEGAKVQVIRWVMGRSVGVRGQSSDAKPWHRRTWVALAGPLGTHTMHVICMQHAPNTHLIHMTPPTV